MPTPRDPQTSSRLSRQRRAGTRAEIALVSELRRRKFKVETNSADLPGRPDIVLPRRKLVVFVHGYSWHGCPRHFTTPKHNRAWWLEKIEANRRRDQRKAAQLRRMGWSVLTVWEHEDPDRAAQRIRNKARSLGRGRNGPKR
jgi:DNA mismatch endonuclease (patch repair protein)